MTRDKSEYANQQENTTQGSLRSKSLSQKEDLNEFSTQERNLRQAVLTDFKNQSNYGIQSSLSNLNRWVLLVEDGSNLVTCNCIKVNIPRFLEKYDFETQKNQLDRVEKYRMELNQESFEERSMLEMLSKATEELQPDINKPKRHYKYLFTLQGLPVLSLRSIDSGTQALIVSDN